MFFSNKELHAKVLQKIQLVVKEKGKSVRVSALDLYEPQLALFLGKEKKFPSGAFANLSKLLETSLVLDKSPEAFMLELWAAVDFHFSGNAEDRVKKKCAIVSRLFRTPGCVQNSVYGEEPLLADSAELNRGVLELGLKILKATKTNEKKVELAWDSLPQAGYEIAVLSAAVSEQFEVSARHVHAEAGVRLSTRSKQRTTVEGLLIPSAIEFKGAAPVTARVTEGVCKKQSHLIDVLNTLVATPAGYRRLVDVFATPELFDVPEPEQEVLRAIQQQAQKLQQRNLKTRSAAELQTAKLLRLYPPDVYREGAPVNAMPAPSLRTLSFMNALASRVEELRAAQKQEGASVGARVEYVPLVATKEQNVSAFYQCMFGARGLPRFAGYAQVEPPRPSDFRGFFKADDVFLDIAKDSQPAYEADPVPGANRKRRMLSDKAIAARGTTRFAKEARERQVSHLTGQVVRWLNAFNRKFATVAKDNVEELTPLADTASQYLALGLEAQILESESLRESMRDLVCVCLDDYYNACTNEEQGLSEIAKRQVFERVLRHLGSGI